MPIQDHWTIDWANRILTYTGGFTNGIPNYKYTYNELYSWGKNESDEPLRMKNPRIFKADTTKEYQILWPWFIDDQSMKAVYEGALVTTKWKRTVSTDPGIVQVRYDTFTAQPVSGDIGKTITHNPDGDSGILVGYDNTRKILWIRPDDATAANNFDSVSGDLEVSGGTGDIDQDYAADTGESKWAGIYTLAPIEPNTEIYAVQMNDFVEVTSPVLTKIPSWWDSETDFTDADGVETGHIDILVKIMEIDNYIDEGRVLMLGHQYSKKFAHWELKLTGGRTPAPLGMSDDVDNPSGYRQLLTNAATGSWGQGDVGEIFREVADTKNKAIMTSISGTTPNFTIQYYLIGTQTDFVDTDVLEDTGSTKTLTVNGAPTNVGPAADTSITVTFGGTTGDINEDGTDEWFSCELDCNNQTFDEVYERLKYFTRRGQTTDIDSGSQSGPDFIGEFYRRIGDYYIPYDNGSVDNPFTEGEQVTGPSNFEGYVTSKHDRGTNEGFIIVRQQRGTLVTDGNTLTGTTSGHTADVDEDSGSDPVALIPEELVSPFGTYAGGISYFARGIKPINVATSDASKYVCITSEGNRITPPNKVNVVFQGLETGDRGLIAEVNTAGQDDIKEDQHGLAAGNNEGNSTLVVDSAIPAETPNKTTGGVVWAIDVSAKEETRYRYSSWNASTFTLSTGISGTATGGDTDTLLDSGGSFLSADIKVGDIIKDGDNSEYAVVLEIVSNTEITTTVKATSWSGVAYQSNRLDRNYNGAEDTAFVPQVDGVATGTSMSSTLVHSSDINVVARCRWASGADPIEEFELKNIKVESTGLIVTAIRNPDDIQS
jgi:hypothetical protein